MKIFNSLLLLTLLIPASLFAVDRNVDGTGNVPGSFTDIQSAINAAVDGDRIVIFDAYDPYADTLIVDKSLTFLPASAEDYWHLDGAIRITPANGRVVTIVGLKLLGWIESNGNNPAGARCTVNIIDSFLKGYVEFDEDNYDINVLYTYLTHFIRMRHGSVIGSELSGLRANQNFGPFGRYIDIVEESASFGTGDTVKIIANQFHTVLVQGNSRGMIHFQNSSSRYFIANNLMFTSDNSSSSFRAVVVDTCYLPGNQSMFLNNTIMGYNGYNSSVCNDFAQAKLSYAEVFLMGTTDGRVQNNVFDNESNGGCVMTPYKGNHNLLAGFLYSPGYENNENQYLEHYLFDLDRETGIPFDPDELVYVLDKGNPNTDYVDLDLSRNDLGHLGGPYSWWNYHAQDSTTVSGRARVFDLELPFRIYDLGSGTKVQAKGAQMR